MLAGVLVLLGFVASARAEEAASGVAVEASASAASAVATEPAASAASAASALAMEPAAASAASTPSGAVQPATKPAPGPYATTQQPRSFGHVIGDVLTQRVLLELAGRAVQPASLPAADRVGLFLERRALRIESDETGRRWLVIDYQVINAPRSLIATSLPALNIGTTSAPLNVAAWPVSIGPLTPTATFGQGDLLPLRPDRGVEPLPTAGIERQLKASLGALAAVLLAWAAWWAWRNWREAQRLPFARAWHRMRRLDPDHAEAWLALHHALNATAGRVVHGASLSRLLAEAPHLAPMRAKLEAFFQRSAERFFVDASARSPAAPFPLRELGLALREAERRQRG